MALEAVYPELALIDLLDEDAAEEVRTAKEEAEGKRAVLLLGGVLFAALLLATLATWGLGHLVEQEAEASASQSAVLNDLRAERRERDQRQGDLRTARNLTQQQTNAARIIEDVGRALPEGVWLLGVTWERPSSRASIGASSETGGSAPRVRITGLAMDHEGTAEYARVLERLAVLGGVTLRRSEQVSASAAERAYGLDWPLSRFEFEADARGD